MLKAREMRDSIITNVGGKDPNMAELFWKGLGLSVVMEKLHAELMMM